MGPQCPGDRGTPCLQPLLSLQGFSALFEHKRQCYSAFAALFLLMSAEFSMASSTSLLLPQIFSSCPSRPSSPLSILLCLHVLLHQASFPSGFPLGLASEKPNLRQGRGRRVGLGYLFSCLTPYKVILGALSTRLSPSGFQQSLPFVPLGPSLLLIVIISLHR